ncbi:OsmC family protein [Dongia sedimenti]|uniref:OsmC family protein n=1 Tax=Dongia sedimenti TaxID=3064282 RepID=A0ABU0YLR6_9PROT|nr:OsmC family protein [Rhodospirillaceae bacterium R-7]
MTVELRNIAGTEAALGWAGAHTLVVDRAEGKAGGQGLGFNGGQLLALAIGGCFCNDLRYVAHARGITLRGIAVKVTLELAGEPLLATAATMSVECDLPEGAARNALIAEAERISTVSNSLRAGLPVRIVTAP